MPRPRLSFRAPVFLLFALLTVLPAVAAEKDVELTASDGTKLKATYFAAEKPGPAVLLLHQCNRQRKVWNDLAGKLAASGINVLTIDYRGFGESGGTPFDKLNFQEATQVQTQKWPGDFDVAFDYLVSQPGVDRTRIGVGGASCGVQNSVLTARRHREVQSLVLLSGPANMESRKFLRNTTTLPVFFAVADDDEFPPTVVNMQWLYSLTTSPAKKFVHLSTGGHGSDMFSAHPELVDAIVDWYVTTLIKTPGHAPAPKEAPAIPPEAAILNTIDEPGGAAKLVQKVEQARASDPKATPFSEGVVNLMGYEYIQAGDTKGAIEILKLNTVAYPDSPNTWDSLADAYLADGQHDLARKYSEKTLEMLSSDTTYTPERRAAIKASAEQKLKQLNETPEKQK